MQVILFRPHFWRTEHHTVNLRYYYIPTSDLQASHSASPILFRSHFWLTEPLTMQVRYCSVPTSNVLSLPQREGDIIPSPVRTYWASHSASHIVFRPHFWLTEPHTVQVKHCSVPTSNVLSLTQRRADIIASPRLTCWASHSARHVIPSPLLTYWASHIIVQRHIIPCPLPLLTPTPQIVKVRCKSYCPHSWQSVAPKTVVKTKYFTVKMESRKTNCVPGRKWSSLVLE